MNTDDKFCIQIRSQSVNFKESASLSSSFRLLQGHRKVQATLLLCTSPPKSLRRWRGGARVPQRLRQLLLHTPLLPGEAEKHSRSCSPRSGRGLRFSPGCPPQHHTQGQVGGTLLYPSTTALESPLPPTAPAPPQAATPALRVKPQCC